VADWGDSVSNSIAKAQNKQTVTMRRSSVGVSVSCTVGPTVR